jgi:hypothetical protein
MKYPCQEGAKNESFPRFFEMTCNELRELSLEVEGKRAVGSSSIPGSLRLGRGAEKLAHARGEEQAMPPGPTLDRRG